MEPDRIAQANNDPRLVPQGENPPGGPHGFKGRSVVRAALGASTVASLAIATYLHTAIRCHTSLDLSGLYSCGAVPEFLLDLPYSHLHTYTVLSAGVFAATLFGQLVL